MVLIHRKENSWLRYASSKRDGNCVESQRAHNSSSSGFKLSDAFSGIYGEITLD